MRDRWIKKIIYCYVKITSCIVGLFNIYAGSGHQPVKDMHTLHVFSFLTFMNSFHNLSKH